MNGFLIKLIAILCMTIDHIFKLAPELMSFLPAFKIPLPGVALNFPTVLIILGRLAFPLFAFEIAEGCTHTKNFPKYLRRLFIFALISELPFDFMFYNGFTLGRQNVLWTFLFGACAIFMYQKLKAAPPLNFIVVLLIAAVCYFCRTDYHTIGVILIFALYISKKPISLILTFAIISIDYLYNRGLIAAIQSHNVNQIVSLSLYFAATLSAIPIMSAYKGKKGPGLKWFFYIYYPLHIIVLGLI
jgi:hypothetical protein